MEYYNKFNFLNSGLLTLTLVLFLQIHSVNAANKAVKDSTFSTPEGQFIALDLTSSISGITVPVVTVSMSPSNGGSAVPFDCDGAGVGDGSVQCVTYTPSSQFVGFETFQVTVNDDVGAPETAQVTVKVGNIQNQGAIPPVDAVNNTISNVCTNRTDSVATMCDLYAVALQTPGLTEEDLRILIRPLTPADAAAQGAIGNVLASGQMKNIGKHLAAMRKGQQVASLGGLAFKQNGQTIKGDMLAKLFSDIQTGGGASANSNSAWGWFINGAIGGGGLKESDYINGFDFSTNGISSGFDYRMGSAGVVGAAIGYSNTSLELQQDQGELGAIGASVIGYLSYYPTQESYIDVILSLNNTAFESERRIVFGTQDDIAKSENESVALALSLATGFNAIQSGGFTASVDFKLDYISTTVQGYSETGDSVFNVTIAERDVTQLTTYLGTTMSKAISMRTMVLLPQLDLFWVHQFEEESDVVEGYFSVDTQKNIFRFNSNVTDTDYFRVDFGLSATSTSGTTSFLQLGTTLSRSDYTNWNAAFGIRLEF